MLQAQHMEGYLRPGCVHLTLDALLQVRPALPNSLPVLCADLSSCLAMYCLAGLAARLVGCACWLAAPVRPAGGALCSQLCGTLQTARLRACCLPPLQDQQRLSALCQLGLAGALQQLLDSPCGLGRLMRQAPMLASAAALAAATACACPLLSLQRCQIACDDALLMRCFCCSAADTAVW